MAGVILVTGTFLAAGNLGIVAAVNAVTDSAGSTLIAALISGFVTIFVAVIGLYATRSHRKLAVEEDDDERITYQQIADLRAEIHRLERVCFIAGIDPATGSKLHKDEES